MDVSEKNSRSTAFGEGGFSMLEGMVASAILGVGLLALAAMQGVAMVKNIDAIELTRVTALASNMLERIQFNRTNLATYNNIDTQNAGLCNAITQPQTKGDCLWWGTTVNGSQLEGIRGTITVSNVVAPISLGRRNIVVTLTWQGSQKGDSSVKRARSLRIARDIAPE